MGKLQDYVRECIIGCKSRAEINTQNKAEVLLDKFAQRLDEEGGGIPTVKVGGDTLTWDGNTDGKPIIDTPFTMYKVADNVITVNDVAHGFSVIYNGQTVEIPSDYGSNDDVAFNWNLGAFVYAESEYGEVGVYFSEGVSSLTIPGYTGFSAKEVIDPDYLPEIPAEKLPGRGTVLYENYDGTPPENGVIPCDISSYKYVEVLFTRDDGNGDSYSVVTGMLIRKAAAVAAFATANFILYDEPGTIRIAQAVIEYDEEMKLFMMVPGMLLSYDTTNNMACTRSLDECIFPARIVGYK